METATNFFRIEESPNGDKFWIGIQIIKLGGSRASVLVLTVTNILLVQSFRKILQTHRVYLYKKFSILVK